MLEDVEKGVIAQTMEAVGGLGSLHQCWQLHGSHRYLESDPILALT